MTTYSSFRPQTQNLVITGDTTLGDASGDTITVNGSTLNLAASASRIRGDFSNATASSRVLFQSSTTNGVTSVAAIPNGSSTSAFVAAYNASAGNDCPATVIRATSTENSLLATGVGTFSYLPLTFYTGGSERLRIDTNGQVAVGSSTPLLPGGSPSTRGEVSINGSTDSFVAFGIGGVIKGYVGQTSSGLQLDSEGATTITAVTNGAERLRIDSSGRLLVGTTSTTTSSSQSGEVYSAGATGFLLTNTTAANFGLSVKNEGTSGTRNLINFLEGTGGGTARANISFDSANSLTFSTGGTARISIPIDAGGIKFPATQVGSTDPNTLDDYEEGTWTPTYVTSGGGGTQGGSSSGFYVKIGRLVICTFDCQKTITGAGSGNIWLGGMPFAAGGGSFGGTGTIGYFNALSQSAIYTTIYIDNGSSTANLMYQNTATGSISYFSGTSFSGRIIGTLTYTAYSA